MSSSSQLPLFTSFDWWPVANHYKMVLFNSSLYSVTALSIHWGCWCPFWYQETAWPGGIARWCWMDGQTLRGWWRLFRWTEVKTEKRLFDQRILTDYPLFLQIRPGSQAGLVFRAHQLYSQGKRLTRQRSLPSLYQGPPDPQGSSIVNDEDRQKIGALETELALLRAQVAQLLLAQEKSAQPGMSP